MNVSELTALVSEKKFDLVEAAFKDALLDPDANTEFLVAAFRALSRASGQKSRLQALASLADSTLKGPGTPPDRARLRWTLLKEAVKVGATPSTTEGFHKLFEEALAGAYPESPSLTSLMGRFRFREAKDPVDGLARMERAEKWLPFEVGRCFAMAGRGAGQVVETNFALDSVRLDFVQAKGVSVPIGVAGKSLSPLAPGHFLHEKLTAREALAAEVNEEPAKGLRRLFQSYGRPMPLGEIKEAMLGLVPDEKWTSWWSAARKDPHVVSHGSGKTALITWSESVAAADEAHLLKFEKAGSPAARLDFFRKNLKRDPKLVETMAARLAVEAGKLRAAGENALAFEIAVAIEKVEGVKLPFALEELLPDPALSVVARIEERQARERALELVLKVKGAEGPRLLADWFFKEEDSRTLDTLDRRLRELDPELREATLDRLQKSPRSGPRAFVWLAQKAASEESFRARLTPSLLSRLLDAVSWEELGALRTKVRELFDRTGLAASWMMKQATVEEVQLFLQALGRHNELEPHRRAALLAAAEMRFPELRKTKDETFWVTPEALDAKRSELERIVNVDIPENTKGIALAAAEGDLSENFEYKARKQKQQDLSVRAGQLQAALANARVLEPEAIDASEVRPGTRVTLSLVDGTEVITLLGPWDSKPEEKVYSYQAEVARSLLGKREGEAVVWLGKPGTVIRIERWRS